jgi:hypothetical protein
MIEFSEKKLSEAFEFSASKFSANLPFISETLVEKVMDAHGTVY